MSGPLVPDSEGLWLLLCVDEARQIRQEAVRVFWGNYQNSPADDGLSLFFTIGKGIPWKVEDEPHFKWAGLCLDSTGKHVK